MCRAAPNGTVADMDSVNVFVTVLASLGIVLVVAFAVLPAVLERLGE